MKTLSQIYDYPPYLYLVQVLEHCPKAGATYLSLWKNRNKENKVSVSKKDVHWEYLVSLQKFKSDLQPLVREGLASVDEHPNQLIIELTDWDIDCEGHVLC